MLLFGGDNSVSPPEVIEAFRKLIASGIKVREMVKEGNLYLSGKEENYRWIPKEHFKNFVTVIYGNKVCTDFGSKGLLIINENWAETERHKFEYLWSVSKEVKGKSVARSRF